MALLYLLVFIVLFVALPWFSCAFIVAVMLSIKQERTIKKYKYSFCHILSDFNDKKTTAEQECKNFKDFTESITFQQIMKIRGEIEP